MKSGDPRRRKAVAPIDPSAIVETIRSIPDGSVAC
jgi:hypothetical protein